MSGPRFCRGGACSALRAKRGPCVQVMATSKLRPKRAGQARPLQAEKTQELQPVGEQSAGLNDGGVALGAGGDHSDFDLEMVGDEAQIVHSSFGELGGVLKAVGGFAPAGEGFIDGCYTLVDFGRSRHLVDGRAFVSVTNTDSDFALGVENVEFGDNEGVNAVDHFGIAEFREVQPTAAARAAR